MNTPMYDLEWTASIDIMTGDIAIQYAGKIIYTIQGPGIDAMMYHADDLRAWIYSNYKDEVLDAIEEAEEEAEEENTPPSRFDFELQRDYAGSVSVMYLDLRILTVTNVQLREWGIDTEPLDEIKYTIYNMNRDTIDRLIQYVDEQEKEKELDNRL